MQLTVRRAMKASRSLAALARQRYCKAVLAPAELTTLRRVYAPEANALAVNFERVAVGSAP